MERAALDRDDWTLLRVATPDRPGGLAVFARCMAACGVDILSLEILGHRENDAVADVLVHGGDLDRALRALDDEVVLLGRRSHGDLPDPGLAMASACMALIEQPTAGALLDVALGVVGADVGAIYRVVDGELEPVAMMTAGLDDLAHAALVGGTPSLSEPAAGSALAVPVGDPPVLVIAVARSLTFPFQDAEVARLEALGRLAVRLLGHVGGSGRRTDTPGSSPSHE